MNYTIYAYGRDGVTLGRFDSSLTGCINQSCIWEEYNTFNEPFTVEILHDLEHQDPRY